MPYTRVARTFSESVKLGRRDDNGGITTSTKFGIAFGLICFFAILASFWLIWRWRKSRPPPTEDDIFAQETYARWEDNVLHPGHTSPSRTSRDRAQTRRVSGSTFETYLADDATGKADDLELSPPPQAHMNAHL